MLSASAGGLEIEVESCSAVQGRLLEHCHAPTPLSLLRCCRLEILRVRPGRVQHCPAASTPP